MKQQCWITRLGCEFSSLQGVHFPRGSNMGLFKKQTLDTPSFGKRFPQVEVWSRIKNFILWGNCVCRRLFLLQTQGVEKTFRKEEKKIQRYCTSLEKINIYKGILNLKQRSRSQPFWFSCSNPVWCDFLHNFHLPSWSWSSSWWKPPALAGRTNPHSSLLLLLWLPSVSNVYCSHLAGLPLTPLLSPIPHFSLYWSTRIQERNWVVELVWGEEWG